MRALINKLTKIFITANNLDFKIRLLAAHAAHHRGDGVIRLHFSHRQHRHRHLLQERNASLHLRVQIFRRRLSICLVLRIDLRTKRAPIARRINDHREVLRPILAQQFQEHAHETKRHVRWFIRDRAAHPRPDGVVSAKELRVAVDQVESGHG